jgi:predicted SprT family Zn-dependent metalloprotease
VTTMFDIKWRAEELLRQHGLAQQGWKFVWDKRPTGRAGQCRYGRQEIGLSWKIFSIEANRAEAENTILHEIAHALTPGAHHGPAWKRVARDIGCSAARCHQLETPPRKQGRYAGSCACGTDFHNKHRMTFRNGEVPKFRCNKCRTIVRWRIR